MDQIKPVIEWCKRNVFWIGCFFLSVTMIGSWVFSSLQLASLQKKRESEITTQENAITSIKKTSAEEEVKAHPNEATKAGMDAEIDNTIRAIVTAWNQRYNEQKTILTWPEDILGKETADFFSKVDVPEKLSDPGQGFEKYRKAYYDRIPKYMNKICREVGTNWQYDPELIKEQNATTAEEEEGGPGGMYGGGPMGGMGMGAPGGEADAAMINQMNKYPVTWETDNQNLWQRKLTEFAGYDDHPGGITYPTFMQANMLQQDLWLLEAMFKNIKDVNGGSSSNDLSVIRNIYHVVFGREANAKLGELAEVDTRFFSRVEAAVAGGPMGGMMGPGMGGPEGMDMSAYGDMAAMMGGGGEGGVIGERSAYDRRYVDTTYEPIEASKVKLVLGGAALPEQNLELIVAKRVPFRLAVKMDERKINEFIAICANSEFVFEVNQVRINRYDGGEVIKFNGGATSTAGGGGMGGMGGMYGGGGDDKFGGGMGMGLSMGGPGGENSGPSEALKPTPVESRTDFMVDVEYYGVVKIYNPVRENFLRLAAGQEVIDDTVDPVLVKEAEADAAATAAAAGQPAAAQPNAGAPAQPATGVPAQPANGAPANGETAPAGDAADPNAAQPQDNATTS